VSQTVAVLLVIGLALVAANLPFVFERVLLVLRPPAAGKPFWFRLVELLVWYAAVGLLAYGLESRLGNAFPQRWEFFAITVCLFLVFAYPGFVYRYLRRRHARPEPSGQASPKPSEESHE
jgi:hypothetical protein